MSPFEAFISRQRQLLQQERNAEIERSSLLLTNCGPKLLEQKGLALLGLGVASVNIGLGGKTLIELERPSAYHTSPIFPPHTFRNGDLAQIEDISAKKGLDAVKGVVYRVSDTRVVIAVDPDSGSAVDSEIPERCRLVKLANSVTYDRMDKAIDRLEKLGASSPPPLIQVLLAQKPLSPPSPLSVSDITFFDPNLNDSQKEAVRFCLAAPEVACIHGPPGTGKTHTLIELIRQLTKPTDSHPNGQRILVCGASNLAVDNILERLLKLDSTEGNSKAPGSSQLKVTRIGHPARVMSHQGILDSTLEVKSTKTDQAALVKDIKQELEGVMNTLSGKGKGKKPRGTERKKMWEEVKALRKDYRSRESSIVQTVLQHDSQVVLATCHSAGGRQLRNFDLDKPQQESAQGRASVFDVVIVDEATQAMEAVTWVPIFKAKKLILAGDPMQLPPTVLSLDAERKKQDKQKAKASAAKPKVDKGEREEPVAGESEADDEGDDDEIDDEEEEAKPSEAPSEALANLDISKSKKPRRKREAILVPPRTLEVTLFERLEKMYGSRVKRMLKDAQTDMRIPIKTLYRSKLRSHSSVEAHLLKDLLEDDTEDPDEVLQHPVVFFDTAGCEFFERLEATSTPGSKDSDEGSRCNENEAMIVKQWVEKLVGVGIDPGQVAVITPYQAQVTLLTSLLRPLYGPSLEIGTVDGMQGREKEAVVISLVRSNDKCEVGFLKEKRRMNVAMTRARRHLCVVGDSSTVVHGGTYLKKWIGWLEAKADIRFPDV
ncbi:DNA helicase [Coprinopsis sp. MPI-PUGE-AT-0042]|nr:DNA helicase [Coprinopsis sp. MPI-PUGE-AT-0042]